MTTLEAADPVATRPEGAVVIAEHIRGLGLVRSLGRRGIPVWTFTEDGDLMASASRYSRRSLRWPVEPAAQLDGLIELATRHGLDGWALLSATDEGSALCARHHAELSRHYRVTIPPWDVVRFAYDKRLTHQLATSIGLDCPRTFFPRDRDEVAQLDCPFPAVLKPAFKKEVNRFTHDKAWKADDRRTLVALYDEACALVDPEVVMIQELIPGGGEKQFSFAALCKEGRCLASVTARRTRQYPVDFGHSSCFVETLDPQPFEEPARRLLAAMRYTGLAEVEFKYDEGDRRFKLLEVNPRAWTWHALCLRAGVDFPYLLWQLAHGEAVPEIRGQAGIRWLRVSTDLAAAWTEVRRGRLSLTGYAASLRSPIVLSTFALDDPLPSMLGLPRRARSLLKRLLASGQPRRHDALPGTAVTPGAAQ